MVASVSAVLRRFKTEWATQLQPQAIIGACEEAGYTSWRDRILTPVTTIQLFLLQMLHGHTACSHVPHLSGLRGSASAYCQARARLPLRLCDLLLALYQQLNHEPQTRRKALKRKELPRQNLFRWTRSGGS